MSQIARITLAASLACLLGACASPQADYPKLSIREAERVEGQFATGERARLDVPPLDIDLTGDLEARLASLVTAAEQAHEDFLAARPRASELVTAAVGSNAGSDQWASAQVALAELDSARSLAAIPLGDLDALYTAARVSAEDVAAIDIARGEVIALMAEEDAILADLRGKMP